MAYKNELEPCWLLHCIAILFSFNFNQCHGQIAQNAALSSPSHFNVMKHSAVWLHWNYTFNGGNFFQYEKQEIFMNDTVQSQLTLIAEKIGENGQLQVKSGLSSELMNRLTAFGNNNTVMIKNMEYNDSTKLFQSKVELKIIINNRPIPVDLKPVISISVSGQPTYLSAPQGNMDVAENSNFMIIVRFDGNPKPSGGFQWSHQNSKTAMIVDQEYPYSYKGTYQLASISSSYCGRIITTTLSNNVGNAADQMTTVTVLLNLDASPNLRADKSNQSCVQVTWQKKESGLCNVNYAVKFKNANGTTLYDMNDNNIAEMVKCGIPSNVNITHVELTMTSTKRSKSFTANVQQSPLPPPTTSPPSTTTETATQTSPKSQSKAGVSTGSIKPKASPAFASSTVATEKSQDIVRQSSDKGAYIGLSITIVFMMAIIIFLLTWVFKLRRAKATIEKQIQIPKNPISATSEAHYMDLQIKGAEAEPRYATLQQPPHYESI